MAEEGKNMKVLAVGDIVGTAGINKLKQSLKQITEKEKIDFVIVNAENSAEGMGITEKNFKDITSLGVDCITMGNHTWGKKDIFKFIDSPKIIRPANYPEGVVGKGYNIYTCKGKKIAVMNLMGRVDINILKENPFYENYDWVLDICRKYDVTISLGDACRPGCIEDASDISQIEELVTLGELTKRAWEKDVQVMIEGPGHMPLNQIQANMEIQKSICKGAPFYVLGPLVTDIAPGYDHITSAIGGAVAATYGASFLCYVTPAEHLRLPDLNDVKEGIIAAKIAAHAADIAKGIPGASDWDKKMSTARKKLDWEEMFDLAIDPEKARRYRESARPEKEDTCSMCGNFCAVKNMNRILDGEIVSIFDE